MYYTDSMTRRVDVFDYDLATGEATQRRLFTDLSGVDGVSGGSEFGTGARCERFVIVVTGEGPELLTVLDDVAPRRRRGGVLPRPGENDARVVERGRESCGGAALL
jgi:hypothetical protein